MVSYIGKRGGSANFYVRLLVPDDLREIVGRGEYRKSLGTSDLRKAKAKAATVIAAWQTEFETLRRRRLATTHDLAKAGWDHYLAEIEMDERQRANLPSEQAIERERVKAIGAIQALPAEELASPLATTAAALDYVMVRDKAEWRREQREILKREIKKHLAVGETVLVQWAADWFIEREKLLIEPSSGEYKALCQRLLRAHLEALERASERDQGDWSGTPRDPVIRPPEDSAAPRLAAPGETIMALFERFKRERFASAKPDTWDQAERDIRIFADFVGPSCHISVITRKAVRDWKQGLLQFPLRASETKAFDGLSFKEIVESNRTIGKRTLADKTVNRMLSALSKYCDWLRANEFLESNPVDGHYLEIDKRKRKVRPYSTDQLTAIFTSPLFSACAGDDSEHIAGDVKIRDWRYWLPFISLFSGARLGEIAQLFIDDVREQNGVWFFHVTDEEDADGPDEKSIKTEGSARVVPIHPELIRLGLLDYREQLKARGETRLFPTAERDTRGHFGEASRFFGRYFAKIGVKIDRTTNFHSFRHGVADAFRRAGYLDEQFAMLLGHTEGTTTGRYGILPQGELMRRKEMIDSIDYPGLNLHS